MLVISDDLPEIAATCCRALLLHRGRIVEELGGEELDEKRLLDSLRVFR